MKKVIAVTGADGFVGKNLFEYMSASPSVQLRKWKARDEDTPGPGCNVIIHLAGKAHDTKGVADNEEYVRSNFLLTKKVFDYFLGSTADVFIFVSSVKAVKDIVSGTLTEEDIPEPVTPYGKTKLMAENYLLENAVAGKEVFILRPCMIYGPGNKGNLNLLYKVVKTGIPYPLMAYENSRSFLSVENLCFVMNEIVQRDDVPPGIYNVSDDKPLATSDIIRIISEVLGKRPMLWKINRKLIQFAARAGDFLHMPFTSERLRKLTENYLVSNQKLISVLEKKLPVDSEEGLRSTIQAFLNDK